MTTDHLLRGDEADDLRALPARVRRARLSSREWAAVAEALGVLRDRLATGTERDVLRAAGVFDDLFGVRVRADPGGLALEELPDAVAYLVHEVELAVGVRTAETDGLTHD